jgi:hypothetical protein
VIHNFLGKMNEVGTRLGTLKETEKKNDVCTLQDGLNFKSISMRPTKINKTANHTHARKVLQKCWFDSVDVAELRLHQLSELHRSIADMLFVFLVEHALLKAILVI